MSLGITWLTIEAAASKYSLEISSIEKLVSEGVVRTDLAVDQAVLINVDDLELMVQEKASIL